MDTATTELTFHRAATLASFGMPEDRMAHMAARRAFVEMKSCFMRAATHIEGSTGEVLQRKLRSTSEVVELWRLSRAVLGALPIGQAEVDIHRHEMLLQLESAFPEGGGPTAFVPL